MPVGNAAFLLIVKSATLLFLFAIASVHAEMSFERLDPAFDMLIPADAEIKVLATGFKWAEGPVWDVENGELLFSDVPNNVIHAWDGSKIREFMRPSGYTGLKGYGRESGSNGLTFDAQGRLILAEHGDRRVSILTKGGGKMTLADRFEGKRFNSPNDVVVHSSGAIYFTDPIYGLPKGEDDPLREIGFCGVYRIGTDGGVSLVTKELERPNGLAFSPDEKTLYVANSHGPRKIILAVSINADGGAAGQGVFFDAKELEGKGSMDGLKVDPSGNLWATGPGGLLVISPQGKLLGRVLTGKATANVSFGGKNSKTVFLTAHDTLLSVPRN
ncbi:SMP-30/gluconolactonase/LRE family protein [Akkermansiaceae bacterium]|nr:SMP-30/gluconolactonase/LRE family protein [Akkermansiaceae bacterium]